MDEFLKNILMQVSAYVIVIVGIFLFLNFMTKGFVLQYLRVKASRGRKVLVRVFSVTGRFYAIGSFKEGLLQFKNKDKKIVSLTPEKKSFFDEMGIKVIDWDENSNKIINHYDFIVSPGVDPVKIDGLMVRCLQNASLQDDIKTIIILVICGLSLLVSGFCAYSLINMEKLIAGLNVVGVV